MVPRTTYLRMRNYISMNDDQSEAPAVLHTSRESRMEGMRHYNLCRELKWVVNRRWFCQTEDRVNHGRRNMVWINFNVDRFIHTGGMLWVLSIDGDGEAYREKNFNFEGAVVKRIRNFCHQY
jgi:hypothetical protein